MVSNLNIPALVLAAAVVLVGMAAAVNIWFENDFAAGIGQINSTEAPAPVKLEVNRPTLIVSPLPTKTQEQKLGATLTPTPVITFPANRPTAGIPTATPTIIGAATLTPTKIPVDKLFPTVTPKPDATNTPIPVLQPTATPSAQVVQFTPTFLNYALCYESNYSTVEEIISNTETALVPIEAEYTQCKASAEAELQSCVNECGESLGCLQQCGIDSDPAFNACDNTYNAQKAPIVNQAITDLTPHCPTISQN